MERWRDTEWVEHDRGRSIVYIEFQEDDSSEFYHPNDVGEQTVLAEDGGCEQANTPYSPHCRMFRELEYVNPTVFDEDGDPKLLSYPSFSNPGSLE